ncbi:MAG: hypothetical protein KGY76_03155 [Candidatus Thermoplasmatota archaeon]|nr:hypothetical protein [Candidatus Thermoplasmatota archaeon]
MKKYPVLIIVGILLCSSFLGMASSLGEEKPALSGNSDMDHGIDGPTPQQELHNVSNYQELKKVGTGQDGWDLHDDYNVTNNISADSTDNFDPIGNTSAGNFTGSFDGHNYTIDGLNIDRGGEAHIGLFGILGLNAEVKNVRMKNADITGRKFVGMLVGNTANASDSGNGVLIKNNRVEGSVTSTTDGKGLVGGLVGRIGWWTEIKESKSTGTVYAPNADWVGGLVGSMEGWIYESYSEADVTGNRLVGGLTGDVSQWAQVIDSYAAGDVDGDTNVGGLVGGIAFTYASGYDDDYGYVTNSYAVGPVQTKGDTVGGLVGNISGYGGEVDASHWDVNTTGQSESAAGTPNTTQEMKDITTFTPKWDITDVNPGDINQNYIWNIVDGNSYPFLSWDENPIKDGYGVRVDAPVDKTETSSGSYVYEFTVENVGTLDDTYDLTASDTQGWGVSVQNTVTVNALSSTVVDVTVDIPAGAGGQTSTVTLTAESQGGTASSSDSMDVTFEDTYDVSVTAPADTTVSSSGTHQFDFDVSNPGDADETYDLFVSEEKGWDVSVQNEVTVISGGTEIVPVDVTIPADAGGVTDKITLSAFSQNSDVNDEDSMNVTLEAGYGVNVTGPDNQEEIFKGLHTYSFSVKNTGTADDTYDLSVTDTQGWTVNVQNTVSVAVGESESVEVEVELPQGAEGTTSTITLTADSQGGAVSDSDNMDVTFKAVNFYEISNYTELKKVGTGQDGWTLDSNYTVVDDIQADPTDNFEPIGIDNSNSFTGAFNGQGHVIKDLNIDRPNENYVGLFGSLKGGNPSVTTEIRNVRLQNASVTGEARIGMLVGQITGGTVQHCKVNGTVTGTDSGSTYTGGLVGLNTGRENESGEIRYSYASGTVETTNGGALVGGLVGWNTWRSYVNESASSVDVFAGSSSWVGGLVGLSGAQQGGAVRNTYAVGEVHGDSDVGGLIGELDIFSNSSGEIYKSYAAGPVEGNDRVGGLVGNSDNEAIVENSFWDIDSTNQSDSANGTGKTTSEMKDVVTFTDTSTSGLNDPWDFIGDPNEDTRNNDYWEIDGDGIINDGYPYLFEAITHDIKVTPKLSTIGTGDSQTYYAETIDHEGNAIMNVTMGAGWSIESGAGGSWTDNVYTSANQGHWNVTGSYNLTTTFEMTDNVTLDVWDTEPDHITITPEDAVANSGETVNYNATLYDINNNKLADVTEETSWSIEDGAGGSWNQDTGEYHTESEGNWTVTADYSGYVNTTGLEVGAPTVDYIVISPEDATVESGAVVNYTASAYDPWGDFIENVTEETTWSIDSGAGGSWNQNTGEYSTDSVGTWTVTANHPDAVNTTSLTVKEAIVDHIEIEPEYQTITAGDQQTYNATAYDKFNNSLMDVTGETNWSIDVRAGGSWNGNVYTSQYSGEWEVTGEYQGKTDTATLTVEAGSPDHINISPENKTINAGDQQSYLADAYDSYGNHIEEVTAQTNWSIENGAGGYWSDNIYFSENTGTWTVTGEYNSLSNTTTLTVVPAGVEYDLTIDVTGQGDTNPTPGTHSYSAGEEVTIEAIPDDGWQFVEWTGDNGTVQDTKANMTSITMNDNYSITAEFEQTSGVSYELTISSTSGGNVSDPGEGSFTYSGDTEVSLQAVADSGYQFVEWTGDNGTVQDTKADTTTITMNDNYSITAEFEEVSGVTYDLTISSTSGGTVIEPGENTFTYSEGTEVDLEAVADLGYEFVEWTGDNGTVSDTKANATTITIDENKDITATFQETIGTNTLMLDVEGNGAVEVNGTEVDVPFQNDYPAYATVELEANASEGWGFTGWTGSVQSELNSITIVMDGDKNITAHFEEVTTERYNLTLNIDGNGTVDVDGQEVEDGWSQEFDDGDSVILNATADDGHEFAGWTGTDLTGREINITINSDMDITAHFEKIKYELTLTTDGQGSVEKDPDLSEYEEGTTVTLTAQPEDGWEFSNWEGDYPEGEGESKEITVTVQDDMEITAHFEETSTGGDEDDSGWLWWLIPLIIVLVIVIGLAAWYTQKGGEDEGEFEEEEEEFSEDLFSEEETGTGGTESPPKPPEQSTGSEGVPEPENVPEPEETPAAEETSGGDDPFEDELFEE